MECQWYFSNLTRRFIFNPFASRYLRVQSQQKKQNNAWNLLKVNYKDTRTTLVTFCLVEVLLEVHCCVVSLVDFKQVNAAGLFPMLHFCTPWNMRKLYGLLMFQADRNVKFGTKRLIPRCKKPLCVNVSS